MTGRRSRVPAAISPAFLLSGHRRGAGTDGWLRNRRADVVDRLGFKCPRSRVCSPPVRGGAWVCREVGGPLRLAFVGVVGEAEAATVSSNKVSRAFPRLDGVSLRRRQRARGDGALDVEPWQWSPRSAARRLCQVIVLLSLFWLDVGRCLVDVVVGRPNRAPFSLGGDFYQLRAQIWELEPLGRCPGCWRIAVGFIPFFVTGVYFGSFQSMRADVFSSGWRSASSRGSRRRMAHEESRGINVIFSFFGVLRVVSVAQRSLYPVCMCLYLYARLYVLLNQ